MPFKHLSGDNYVSPSGRHFNGAQVRLWYAGGGKFPGQKHGETHMKSSGAKEASYANGGPVLGKESDFMKTPDRFRDSQFKRSTEDDFSKGSGRDYAAPVKGKSLPAIKPQG